MKAYLLNIQSTANNLTTGMHSKARQDFMNNITLKLYIYTTSIALFHEMSDHGPTAYPVWLLPVSIRLP